MFKSGSLRTVATSLSLATALTFAASSAFALTYATIPGGSATNDGLVPVYGTNDPRYGWYGAQLYLIGDATTTITAELLGSEAGFNNTFTFAGVGTLAGGGNSGTGVWAPNPASPLATLGNFAPGAGLLDFAFHTDGNGGQLVANGTNPDGFGPNSPINFFASFAGSTATNFLGFGQEVILWLDDGGAGPDDNHDDLAIRLRITGGTIGIDPNLPAPDPTPLPAAAYLFISVVGGAGVVSRLRAKKAAKKAAA